MAKAESKFVRLREGVLEHLQDGRISMEAFGLYCALLLKADWRTGICKANASMIAFWFGALSGSGSRSARAYAQAIGNHLRSLKDNGFINFDVVEGSHKPYPILIHKYEISLDRDKWKVLDAFAPGSLQNPVYVNDLMALSEHSADSQRTLSRQSADGQQMLSRWSADAQQTELLYKVVDHRYKNIDSRSKIVDQDDRAAPSNPKNSDDSPNLTDDLQAEDDSCITLFPEETDMAKLTQQEAARFLANRIYSLAGRTPTETMVDNGGNLLLDIVKSEDKYKRLLIRARYALVESETAGFVKKNRKTGEEYTLYDAMLSSKDPVATFVRNYEWIKVETDKWSLAVKRKKEKDNPRAGRLMTFPDAITGEIE